MKCGIAAIQEKPFGTQLSLQLGSGSIFHEDAHFKSSLESHLATQIRAQRQSQAQTM